MSDPNTPAPPRVAVVMAGGAGERFWPLSRRDRPKQLLHLTDPDRTLLQAAVDRVAPIFPPDRRFVATGRTLQAAIRDADLALPARNVLAEPCKRNTAGALAWVAAQMLARFEEDVTLCVLTADHAIGDEDRFRATVETAMLAAEAREALVTIGIRPTRPTTGYGYIEVAEGAEPLALERDDPPVYEVERFHEKPGSAEAERYAASGRFYWNSGMFFWRLSTFLAELARARPDFAAAVREMADALKAGDEAAAERVFESLESISIDYALMERASRVLVARGDFHWDDIGSWDALERAFEPDAAGNVTAGDPVLVDVRDCVVYNDAGPEKMAVAVLGCEDLVVVACPDGVLVARKDRVQDVKQIVAQLRERGAGQV